MRQRPQPIAVVGFAFRFPKGVESLPALRRALSARFSAIDAVPPDRWSVDFYYSADPQSRGKSYIRRGGFLSQDISQFDAGFFGISPRVAENMDPQQRLLLEVVWEAFENAGLSLPGHAGRQVGVYVGGFMLDHMISQMAAANRSQINQHTAAGMMMTMLSNRISHTFDLRGPSLSIDTACSSSLVAFHYACQDIWNGAAELAVVGGANVMLRPEYPMGMCKGQFLSRDGECKSFDARGDGYGRGEGAAAVLLKPLDRAIADGDRILATVLATGTNQDGHTPGISMPSRDAQERLIHQVCHKYEIDPARVHYVECHGTGTAVGDPIESHAIGSVYGAARRGSGPVVVGSIKSNIGHTEAVAGVAGVIKTVLTLMDRCAYPLANLQSCHPEIPFDELNLRISDQQLSLPEEFCAAINSFGYGGSNAHAILQTAPRDDTVTILENPNVGAEDTDAAIFASELSCLLPLSARDEGALAALAGRYLELLTSDEVRLVDLLFSASHKRAHLERRAVIRGTSRAQLIEGLQALRDSQESPQVVINTCPFQGNPAPVFVFTGMGPQWWAMGQQLYQQHPTYRAAVQEADQLFEQLFGWSVLAEMLKSERESRITETRYAQPANLLIQIGIFAVLKAAGIQPGAVVGHSVGELAAAYAAGVLSLRDCLTVCYHRSQLQATCAGTGGMLAAAISQSRALELIDGVSDRVSIAAVNGPNNVTLAGDIDCLADLGQQLTASGIFNRRLEVEVPYHSPMMEPIMQPLQDALAGIVPQTPKLPIYSTVTGQRVPDAGHACSAYGASYWPLNARQAVLFAPAIEQLLNDGYTHYLEVGPHPVLATSLGDCIRAAGKECRTLFTLRKQLPEIDAIERAIMSAYASGVPLDWSKLHRTGRFIDLPNYPWQRQTHWLENDRARQDRIAPVDYPILGIQEAPGAPHYRNDFDHQPLFYLRDHVVTGMPVLPAAAYVEALLELAMIHWPDARAWALRDLSIQAPLLINAEKAIDFVTDFDPLTGQAAVRSAENGRLGFGQLHVQSRVGKAHCPASEHASATVDLNHWRKSLPEQMNVQQLYDSLSVIGLTYGPAFQTVRELRVDPAAGKVMARIAIEDQQLGDLHKYRLHPTLLDACFHSLITMLGDTDGTYLPTGLQELCLYTEHSPQALFCLGERIYQDARHIDCNLTIVDETGRILATIRGMRMTMASRQQRGQKPGDQIRQQVLNYDWLYGGTLGEPKRLGHWLVIAGDVTSDGASDEVSASGLSLERALIERIESFGVEVSGLVMPGQQFTQQGQTFTMRPGNRSDMEQILSSCGPLDGVAFLHGLSATLRSSDPTAEMAILHLNSCMQAIGGWSHERTPRVYVVTQCALPVKNLNRRIEPGQSAINGWVRVAFNELEGFQCSTIDLPDRIDNNILDMLTQELLCDDEHDEVALRGAARYVSELMETTQLTDDRVMTQAITDQRPVKVRAVLPNVESVGSARLLATDSGEVGPGDVRLRIESMAIPRDILLDPNADTIAQPMVELVARVLEVGHEVADLTAGSRVCGFAPADLCSHMCGARDQYLLTPLDEQSSAATTAGQLGLITRAHCAADLAQVTAGQKALVVDSPLGLVLADLMKARGASVCVLSDTDATLGLLQGLVDLHTEGNGFDYLVADLEQWDKHCGYWMIRSGGHILDTNSHATSVRLPNHVGGIVRTDLDTLASRPSVLRYGLTAAVASLQSRTSWPVQLLDVTVSDLALRKLPLRNEDLSLTLTFSSGTQALPMVMSTEMTINTDGTYLITGGLGGFGLKTAAWLIEKGARNLVLTSRTGLDSDQRRAAVCELTASGARVEVIACDGADRAAVAAMLETIQQQMPPLVGIYHSAAVIIDHPVMELDAQTLRTVMRNKALAAWHLHELTADLPLEQFVMYSSVANLVGNSRQAAYSAANGFLNGLAFHRLAQGAVATAVNWGVISDVGVVAQDEKLAQYLLYTGLRGIEAREALEALEAALARQVPQFGLTKISSWSDWARFESHGSKSPRFATLIASDSDGAAASARDALVAELATLSGPEQIEVLSALIQEIIGGVLKSDASSISIDRRIEQLGVDSLMATEIQMLLNNRLGLSVSVLELIGDATIRSLTQQSVKNLLSGTAGMNTMTMQAAN